MAVLRIVPDIPTPDPTQAKAFYEEVLGLDILMDQGWIATYGAQATATPQISFAAHGGNDTPVPALSIEVDDLEDTLSRCKAAGFEPSYGPTNEPWGVRRFFVTDPFGTLINILQHI